MELALLLVTAALAATRWATLVIVDDFGPIRDVREWFRYRWPAEDDAYYESEVIGHDDVGWETKEHALPVFPDFDTNGIRVFYPVYPHPVGLLLSCVRCMSVWTGLAATLVALITPKWVAWPVLLPFAFSQIAITLARND